MVGLQVLVLAIGVRIPVPEPNKRNRFIDFFCLCGGKRHNCLCRGRDSNSGAMSSERYGERDRELAAKPRRRKATRVAAESLLALH